MKTTYLTIGTSPTDESSAQFGSSDYAVISRRECVVYKRMLTRLFPPPDGASLHVMLCPYEEDYYREVQIAFFTDDSAAAEYAYSVENNSPTHWDAIARFELLWLERKSAWSRAVAEGDITAEKVPVQYQQRGIPQVFGTDLIAILDAHPL